MVVICADIDSFLLEFYSSSQVSVTRVKGQSDKERSSWGKGRMTIALTRLMCCRGRQHSRWASSGLKRFICYHSWAPWRRRMQCYWTFAEIAFSLWDEKCSNVRHSKSKLDKRYKCECISRKKNICCNCFSLQNIFCGQLRAGWLRVLFSEFDFNL